MSYYNPPKDWAQCSVKTLLSEHPDITRVDLCRQVSERLQMERGLSEEAARIETLKAVADEEARGIDAHIDLDKSTSFCLFVRTESGTHALSIKEVMTLLEQPA